ncbi:MAG: hypothetical protein F6K17_25150 [Okeania sp. SIO3C4]|nr:hypothetical protein [Okeania sp. SIO3C4]
MLTINLLRWADFFLGVYTIDIILCHVRLNTYTLEEGRQKAEGRRQKGRKD